MKAPIGCAVLMLMLSGCGKDDGGTSETVVTKPPVAQVYTCSTDQECRVTCESPGSCCGQGCECTHVYVEAEFQAFHAENTKRCAEKTEECDQYSCTEPTHKTIAMCVDGACKGKRIPITTVKDGYFRAASSPEPLTCKIANDCIGDTLPTATGCCNAPTSLGVYNKSYKAWLTSWRTENCEDATCPPPPNPSQPPECAFEMQCLEGRCANRCAP